MNNVTIIRPQNHDEWLEVRKSGIGSSEVATIVGLNPYETPYQLWRRKCGTIPPTEENTAMRMGHELEETVARLWSTHTGIDIITGTDTDYIIRDNDRTYLQVSPDREYNAEGERGILECKTTRKTIDPNDIPKNWFCQLTYQLGVAGYPKGNLAWLSCANGFEFDFREVNFVQSFYDYLIDEVSRFWNNCVIGGKEPDALNTSDLLLKYPAHTTGKFVESTEEVMQAWQELKDVRTEIDALEERKTRLEDQLKMAIGDAEGLCFGESILATWKSPKPSAKVDTKKMIADYPDIAEQYKAITQGARRFLVK